MSESPKQNVVTIRVVQRRAPELPTPAVCQPPTGAVPWSAAAEVERERAEQGRGLVVPAFLEVAPDQFVPIEECTPRQITAAGDALLKQARKLTNEAAALHEVARRRICGQA